MTENGLICQAWNVQTPHEHEENDEDTDFPLDVSVDAAVNYCRDPDTEGRPWCYTMDPDTRWEFCAVPTCEGLFTKYWAKC